MTIEEKKLRQIQLMLEIANRPTTPPGEAEAAMAKATEFMLRYGIDEAQLAAASSDAVVENIIMHPLYFTGTYAPEELHMAFLIASAFGLQSYQVRGSSSSRSDRRLYLVGFERDVELSRLMIGSLSIQCAIATAKHLKEMKTKHNWASMSPGDKYKHKRAFILGFGKRVAERIEKMRRQVITESGESGAVAVRGREITVREWLESNVDGLRSTSSVRKYSVNAQLAGGQAGQQADIGGTKVGVHTGHKAISS